MIPCAGSGSRAGAASPKQYLPLAGVPMVVHTLRAFAALPGLGQGVIVVAPQDREMAEVIQQYPQDRFVISPTGGATRAQSVLAGLRALQQHGVKDDEWVMVHDAARCLLTPALIEKLWLACQNDEVGGLLALPVPDTLKIADKDRVASTLSRSGKWLAQTPQMFRHAALTQALLHAGDQVTDEASAIEAMGRQPKLVTAAAFNFKVTYPEDMQLAEAVLASRSTAAAKPQETTP
ncbi:MAG: 2-C-methyl-D-erythritol 4-phosphate cytidylyltransferase [Betaproteobacteria bacterium]